VWNARGHIEGESGDQTQDQGRSIAKAWRCQPGSHDGNSKHFQRVSMWQSDRVGKLSREPSERRAECLMKEHGSGELLKALQ
jgi:hypothetical protein